VRKTGLRIAVYDTVQHNESYFGNTRLESPSEDRLSEVFRAFLNPVGYTL
jgi:hypothetical protein